MEELIKRIRLGKWRNPNQTGMIDVGMLAEVLEQIVEELEDLDARVTEVED